ncbi:MAG: hypothetical protein H7A46_08500 [Verrucomicrobiales bacterium]|nr:hypothetical protein [Verrucomicrobiales bacterium]
MNRNDTSPFPCRSGRFNPGFNAIVVTRNVRLASRTGTPLSLTRTVIGCTPGA